ncbi:unnamed protein product [Trichobilharzia szidati]|nr:unnamed protein product [Trichobilharzia szidati]
MRWSLHSKLPVLASLAVHFRRRMLVNNKQLTLSLWSADACLTVDEDIRLNRSHYLERPIGDYLQFLQFLRLFLCLSHWMKFGHNLFGEGRK